MGDTPQLSAEDQARGILARLDIREDFCSGDLCEFGNLIAAEGGLRRCLRAMLDGSGDAATARKMLEWADRGAAIRERADARRKVPIDG